MSEHSELRTGLLATYSTYNNKYNVYGIQYAERKNINPFKK